jgi:uncharacterized OB-fold protein
MSVEDHREDWEGPVPVPNGVAQEFWAGTLEGELRIQRCDCGHVQFYPRVVCTECGALEPDFEASEGVGEVYAYTVCHIPGGAGFADMTPYPVATIELAEGPRLLARLDADPDEVDIGTPVEATFWQVSDEAAIPVFRPR